MHWLQLFFGFQNGDGNSSSYLFWSGFGSDLGELAIVAGLVSIYRKHNCHAKGCFRLGKFPVDGTPFITCRKHHPHIDAAPTAEQIAEAHAEAVPEVTVIIDG